MNYLPTAKQTLNDLREQADRLIATHIMGWEVRKVDFDTDGCFHEAYFEGDKQMEYVDTFEFYPSEFIKDSFWVMDTISVARDIRFVIDTNAKRETTVTIKSLMGNQYGTYGIFGLASTTPLAVTKAVLYLIADDNPDDEALNGDIRQLIDELNSAEVATLEFDSSGSGIKVDLDKYLLF